jgi:hypothetical protein
VHLGAKVHTTERERSARALNQCSRSSSIYNPVSAESEPQHTPVSPVDIVPFPKRKGQQRRRRMGKIIKDLNKFSFINQLDESLDRKTAESRKPYCQSISH